MRVLIGPDAALPEVYAASRSPWLRSNMVATVDGATTGSSGTSKTINSDADSEVFALLRELADVIIVGAGTARSENYAPNPKPMVVVSRSASVPESLLEGEHGPVLLATVSRADKLDHARELLGPDNVLVLGSHRVDLAELRRLLEARGYQQLLAEGGPHLLRDLLDQGCVDEVDTTVVPQLIGGTHPRMLDGPPVDVPLRLHTLVEQDGTLLARWLVDR
ncbi:dihydrofolate reductase family protein [Nocardioides coralli]|uniref:dihydrofolate reductase family protein n=1 Tax=Nocardioides coralli TaxID=2872154 RepID=UPI001CA3FFE0|nr:dihydrofolate reductase family protein [Nocardioides coralli]QZY28756.1 dihydrofolate reductase family protein [Nocardioides coralli]